MHLLHVCVSSTVHRAPVDVVAELAVLQDEHAHIGHGAQVHVVLNSVLNEPLVYECVEYPLENS